MEYVGYIATILAAFVALITIIKFVRELYTKLNIYGFFHNDTSKKDLGSILADARIVEEHGYPHLAKAMQEQASANTAQILASKKTRYLGPTIRTLILLIVCIGLLGISALFGRVSIILENEVLCIITMTSALLFFFLIILYSMLLNYGVSNVPNARERIASRKARRESRKKRFNLNCREIPKCASDHDSYLLIDTRSSEDQKRGSIINSIQIPDDLSSFAKSIPSKTVIFVCSNYGKESHPVVDQLKSHGFEDCYDVYDIKEHIPLINRAMYELEYRNMVPLLVDS